MSISTSDLKHTAERLAVIEHALSEQDWQFATAEQEAEWTALVEERAAQVGDVLDELAIKKHALDRFHEEIKRARTTLQNAMGLYERKKAILSESMQKRDEKKAEGQLAKGALCESPGSLDVFDEASIPDIYLVSEIVSKVDKTAVKKAIEAGEDVPGARIVRNKYVRITADKSKLAQLDMQQAKRLL